MKFGNISTSITLESFNNAPKPSISFFYFGCNFRCGFCHNNTMLGKINPSELMSEEQLKKTLQHAKNTWKQMVVVGGGEPTLDPNLPAFLRYLKNDWGFEIKLDTNGSRPDVLKQLITEGLLDYVAMDIKGTKEQYQAITGFSNILKIDESIKLVQTLPEYEFRTTVLPNFHTKKDMEEIGIWLKGSKRFFLQQFRPDLSNGCLDPVYCKLIKMPKSELEDFATVLKPFITEVSVR